MGQFQLWWLGAGLFWYPVIPFGWCHTMNIPRLTNHPLIALHQLIAEAQAADDAATVAQRRRPFGVRDYPDWRKQAGAFEAEMKKRGLVFEHIEWAK
jgi:hypothetical protein